MSTWWDILISSAKEAAKGILGQFLLFDVCIFQLEYIYNTLYIENLKNLTLPDWTKPVFPGKLKPLAALSFAVSCYTPEMARLKTGPLFQQMLEHFTNTTNLTREPKVRKMWMYSGHDTTIADVLMTLGAFQYHSPPYASTIMFELRRSTDGLYVNVFYKNSTSEVQNITIRGCDEFDCPFEKFADVLSTIRLTRAQWESQCKMRFLGILPFSMLQYVVFVTCSALFSILCVSFVISIICMRRADSSLHSYIRIPNEA